MRWVLLVAGLHFPAAFSLLDCVNRDPHDFEGGQEDKRSWVRWLIVAVATTVIGVGYGIVLAYYYGVVRRNTPSRSF